MDLNDAQYSAVKTLWKAVVAFVESLLGVSTGILVVRPPETFSDLKETWPAFCIAVLVAVVRAVRNYLKQKRKAA